MFLRFKSTLRHVLISDAGVVMIISVLDLTLLNSRIDASVFNRLNTFMSLQNFNILLNCTYTCAVNSLFGTRMIAIGRF